MKYKRLPFDVYFTICSQNCNGKKCSEPIAQYKSIPYNYKGEDYNANYQVRFDEKRQCIQVIFQATTEMSDWRANFDFPAKMYDQFTFEGKMIQIKAHGGWAAMWFALQDTVRIEIATLLEEYPNAFIEGFGWSLGSGIAQLAAEDIYFKFGIKPYLYTFGSVKPFFGKSTYNYVQHCCEKAYNFYDHCDIVGYMVPFFGWRAINHIKVELEKFCIAKLCKPQIYHTKYDTPELYKNID